MKVIELLSDESKWTKGSYALDTNHESVGANDINSVCWCLEGAIKKCYVTVEERMSARKTIEEVINKDRYYKMTAVGFNDHDTTKFEDVIRYVKLANI